MIKQYTEKKNEIITTIQKLEDPRYIDILYKRYVEFETFERIADEKVYSWRHILRLHKQALKHLKIP